MERYLLSIGKPLLTRNKWSGGKKIVIPLLKISCAVCGKKKMVKRISQKCCSNKCARLLLSKDPKYIQKLRDAQLKLIANGTHSGWKTRNILSYPEKFFITVLNNNGLRYTPNKPVNGYFLDFAIEEKMIDLEIDGKQHEYPERKVADTIRDSNLTKHGWKVYRIKWNEIKTDTGKQQMKEKIDAFLKMYENV
jgi:very-short-patch-repair endonuclease